MSGPIFYVGLHQPSDAQHFDRCMISVNRLARRVGDFDVGEWIMDAGAFTVVRDHGGYPHPPEESARRIVRWSRCGRMVAACSDDFMCEAFILKKWGRTVEQHQRWTIERYDVIRANVPAHIHVMPTLQGGAGNPDDYVRHLDDYGDRLTPGMWVGVGSVCKLQVHPRVIVRVLDAIQRRRPDLRLHGFGVKVTALESAEVRARLHSADSMAWSFAARWEGRDANDWREAKRYVERIERSRLACAEESPQLEIAL